MPIAVVVLSAAVFLFMTPSLLVEAVAFDSSYVRATGAAPFYRIVSLVALAAPIGAMIIRGIGAKAGRG